MNNLGIMSALGHGTDEDNVQAYAWFAAAALAGETDAASNRDLTARTLSASESAAATEAFEQLAGELGLR